MFIRELKNRSGSVNIQIISKARGRYKVVKTMGSATSLREIKRLKQLARQEITKITRQPSLFVSREDEQIEKAYELSI